MSIFYIRSKSQKYPQPQKNINQNSFLAAIAFFQGYDEETGKQYNFIPKFPPNQIDQTNTKLQKLWINTSLQNTNKGVCLFDIPQHKITDLQSYFFAFTIFYGKFNIHNNDLKSAKIHLPLFGQYLNKKKELDKRIIELQKQWIFLKTSTQESKDGLVYQITITDYQILQSFANFLKPIEKIERISKHNYMQEAKQKLLEHEPQLKNLLKEKTLKLLTK